MDPSYYSLSESALLKSSVLYEYRYPLAILGALVISIVFCMLPGSNKLHEYLRYVIVPLIGFVISLVIVEEVAKLMLPSELIAQEAEAMRNTEEGFFDYLKDYMLGKEEKKDEKEEEHESEKIVDGYGEIGVMPRDPSYIPFKNPEESGIQSNYSADGHSCLLTENNCGSVCSGVPVDKRCPGLISSVPGPLWQVPTAQSVAQRLLKGDFVPALSPFETQ